MALHHEVQALAHFRELFDRDRRDYYRLEDIWSDAPDRTDVFLRARSTAPP
jgi:hypothetical protein